MRLNQSLKFHIKDHAFAYFFVIVMIVSGVVAGTLAESMLSERQTEELQGFMGAFIDKVRINQIEPPTFTSVLLNHAKFVATISVAGLVVLGLPIIAFAVFLRGFALGFSMGFLLQEMGWQGIGFALASLVPQNIVAIPLYVILAVVAIVQAIKTVFIARGRRRSSRKGNRYGLVHYGLQCGIVMVLLNIAAVVEVYITPLLMRLFVSLI